MYSEDLYKKQEEWAKGALFLMRELLPLMAPVGQYSDWTDRQQLTMGELLAATARSSESAMLLIAYGQLWDAEMPARSVTEGSLKLAYLLQNKEEFPRRHKEYSHDLFQISLFKDHKKALELLTIVDDADKHDWKPIRDRVLEPEHLEEINLEFPQSMRRALEQRWGFAGLIQSLVGSGDPLFVGVSGLSHKYSIASHILHADTVGTSISLERDMRAVERRNTLHLAHTQGLLFDLLSSFILRLSVGYRFVGADLSPVVKAVARIEELKTSFGNAYKDWMDVEYRAEDSGRSSPVGEKGQE